MPCIWGKGGGLGNASHDAARVGAGVVRRACIASGCPLRCLIRSSQLNGTHEVWGDSTNSSLAPADEAYIACLSLVIYTW